MAVPESPGSNTIPWPSPPVVVAGIETAAGEVPQRWQGTAADRQNMFELGRVQQLRRNFTFVSIFGFGVSLIAIWQLCFANLLFSFVDGGKAGLIWGFIVAGFGMCFTYLSIAELSSMAPTSAGQYHWVSEFAPKSSAKLLSYIVGWLCFTAWQAAITAIGFITGTMILNLVALMKPTYSYQPFQGTLLIIAITAFAIIFNTFLAKKLPLVEGFILILNILGFCATIFTLWILAPLDNTRDVWLTFSNFGGWSTTGTSVMIGLLNPMASMIGFDCMVHMSEEVQDASANVPKAMLCSFSLNWILGFVGIVTMCFTAGELSALHELKTDFPFMQVYYNITGSNAGTIVLTLIVIVTLVAAEFAQVATASRQLWAFSRDKGLPGHRWIVHIVPGWNIPLNAVLVSLAITTLLSLINIGSRAALNAVLALAVVSFIASYMVSIGCILFKRYRHEPLPARPFSLGKWGALINVLALCFLTPIFVFLFFPAMVYSDLESMNWAIVMFTGIMAIALICYFLHGRKNYVPPAALIRRNISDEG